MHTHDNTSRPRQIRPLADRFWEKVDRRGPDECWPFTGSRDARGYGHIGLGGRGKPQAKAHRVAYELSVGPIPPGLCILHSCDYPSCCNPAHLRPGTARENWHDQVLRDRCRFTSPPQPRPPLKSKPPKATRPCPILTEAQAIAIRTAYQKGHLTQGELATIAGVTPSVVQNLLRGHTWQHLGAPVRPDRTAALNRGGRNGQARLDDDRVADLLDRYLREDVTHAQLAAGYGVAEETIGAILRNERWRHVKPFIRARVKALSLQRARTASRNHPRSHPNGEQIHTNKLTEDQVREIRRRYTAGSLSQAALAAEYSVSQPTIGALLLGKTWKHLT
jgi:plasmid maintenance system antidote protein VapI